MGEPHATVHRALTGLLADGIVERVSHGTAHLPSSKRYYLTAQGIYEAAGMLGFDTSSELVRAYPMSREWLALLIRRMDAVAAVYRLASSMSPGTVSLRSLVKFHRRGRFDAAISLHDSRSFGVVRQGPALRRRSLYDRLRAIAEYDYWPPLVDSQHGGQRVGMAAPSGLGVEGANAVLHNCQGIRPSIRSRNTFRGVLRFLPWYSRSEKVDWSIEFPFLYKSFHRFTLLCHNDSHLFRASQVLRLELLQERYRLNPAIQCEVDATSQATRVICSGGLP